MAISFLFFLDSFSVFLNLFQSFTERTDKMADRRWNPTIYFLPFKKEQCQLNKLIRTAENNHLTVAKTFR